MSEFKLTGDKYVSEWNGSSLNPGTDTSPYAHPADSPSSSTNIIVVGTGEYQGIWTGTRILKGDSDDVIIDCSGLNISQNASLALVFENITLRNVGTLFGNPSVAGFTYPLTSCRLDNVLNLTFGGSNGLTRHTSCVYLDTSDINSTNSAARGGSQNCLILTNMNIGHSYLAFSYLAKGKRLYYYGTSANLISNCLNGVLNISGTDYELKYMKDGSPRTDADPLIADLASASGFSDTYSVRGNFAGTPKIINPYRRTVETDSDLLKTSNIFGYIGGVRPSKSVPVNSSDPNVAITTTNIDTADPLNWIIQSPATEGFINIVWKISDTIAEVQRIFLDALLSFYGDATGGTTDNNNVPDNFPASYSTLSAAGLKPNRLIYELRTSQSIGMPTVDSQWDNDSLALGTTAGNYYLQEWNTKPTISTVLGVPYGNGNPLGIGGATNGINARWGNAKIRLTNNRAY